MNKCSKKGKSLLKLVIGVSYVIVIIQLIICHYEWSNCISLFCQDITGKV